MSSTRTAGALGAAAVLLLAACAPATTTGPQTTVSIDPEPSTSAVALPAAPEDPRPEVAWPLTGLDAEGATKAERNRPALSIKIENTDAARPQENLDQADVVFEEYVEYGISRLVAVFHSQYPDSVGPIRSMRPMDQNIMGSFDGPLIFSGAQSRFISAARATGQRLIAQDVGSTGFYRTTYRAAPHNLHGYPETFAAQASDMSAPDQQWDIAYPAETSTAQVEGEKATHLDIEMSARAQPDWKWDADEQLWMRYEDTEPHVTMDGVQLSASNVVMLWVTVQYTSGSSTSSVPETLLAGQSGKGYVASGDHVIPIKWSKAGQFDEYELTTEDGEPVALSPGQTWFELVPNQGVGHSTSIDIS